MRFRIGLLIVACALGICGPAVRTAVAQPMAAPGPEHLKMKELEGTWDATVKMGPTDPGSKGKSVYKMDLGGLWMLSDFDGTFAGMPFHGKGIDGYDPATKKYTSIWIDSMTAAPLVSEGTYDKDGKALRFAGKGVGPDGKPVEFRMVNELKDANHMTFTMNMVGPDGKEMNVLTIEYTRQPKK